VGPFNSCLQLPYVLVPFRLSGVPQTPEHLFRRQPNLPTQHHLFTDQGRNFESSLFREMCELLHIHKSRTTPNRPSANGQVERCNRTLMTAVRRFLHSFLGVFESFPSYPVGPFNSCLQLPYVLVPFRLSGFSRTIG
jgi:hypothetical protein